MELLPILVLTLLCVGSSIAALDPRCPKKDNPSQAVHLPHPTDCGKFLTCRWGGETVAQDCPAGLHWNDQHKYCDWPASAGCESAGNKEPACIVGALLPHEDCDKFYQCTNGGVKVPFKCPPGLHFDADKKTCDFPTIANCAVQTTSAGTETTSNSNLTSTTELVISTTPSSVNTTSTSARPSTTEQTSQAPETTEQTSQAPETTEQTSQAPETTSQEPVSSSAEPEITSTTDEPEETVSTTESVEETTSQEPASSSAVPEATSTEPSEPSEDSITAADFQETETTTAETATTTEQSVGGPTLGNGIGSGGLVDWSWT